jgi:hypothetical protein
MTDLNHEQGPLISTQVDSLPVSSETRPQHHAVLLPTVGPLGTSAAALCSSGQTYTKSSYAIGQSRPPKVKLKSATPATSVQGIMYDPLSGLSFGK